MNYKLTIADSLGQLLNKLHGCESRQPSTLSGWGILLLRSLHHQPLPHPFPSHPSRISLISFLLWVKNVNSREAYVSWSCIMRELHAESLAPLHTINPGQLIGLNGFHSVGPRENRTPHLQDLAWEAGEKRRKEKNAKWENKKEYGSGWRILRKIRSKTRWLTEMDLSVGKTHSLSRMSSCSWPRHSPQRCLLYEHLSLWFWERELFLPIRLRAYTKYSGTHNWLSLQGMVSDTNHSVNYFYDYYSLLSFPHSAIPYIRETIMRTKSSWMGLVPFIFLLRVCVCMCAICGEVPTVTWRGYGLFWS